MDEKSKNIVFMGQKYHFDGLYWVPGGGCAGGRKRLHVAVWEASNGQVPEGYHVHHIDHDPHNNALANLECIDAGEHIRYHGANLTDKQRADRSARMDKIRPLTVAWHRSEEGRAWHSEHAKTTFKREPRTLVCKNCQTSFTSAGVRATFCSVACKAAARRKRGVDDIEKQCCVCAKAFMASRYVKTRPYCSTDCSASVSWRAKRLQPNG